MYLESLHYYCFRYNKETPKVLGLEMFKPKGLNERMCYKVLYESDNTIDYIPEESINCGHWRLIEEKKKYQQPINV